MSYSIKQEVEQLASEFKHFKGLKVIVTGGTGFIGSNLVRRLVNLDYDVKVMVTIKKLEISSSDIRDKDILAKAVKDIDAIIHLAAKIDVRESIVKPLLYHDVNVMGTMKLLEEARKKDVSKFILASSCALYGEAIKVPIDESHPTLPLSPYAASKLAAKAYCHAYASILLQDVSDPRQYGVVIGKEIENGVRNK